MGTLNQSEAPSLSSQFIEFGRARGRIQVLAGHLRNGAAIPQEGQFAMVPAPHSAAYFSWMQTLLQHPSTMGKFLQQWFKDCSVLSQRRIHVIAAHLSAPPVFLDVF
ncbi:hypothetical protein BASA81_001416 [Batrachochytrium salamandrivorans]|nr:hypothetical protein BASA81_001416 [Batrachochytrium salamandrivorans]